MKRRHETRETDVMVNDTTLSAVSAFGVICEQICHLSTAFISPTYMFLVKKEEIKLYEEIEWVYDTIPNYDVNIVLMAKLIYERKICEKNPLGKRVSMK